MALRIVPVAADHDLSGFDCGDHRRNHWLKTHALANHTSDYSATYIGLNPDNTAAGFYSLCAASIARQMLPRSLRHGAPEPVPMILLGQLAVALAAQGQRLGDTLVADACKKTVQTADIVGCGFLGIHPAESWLVRYYEKFGFKLVAGITPALMLIPIRRLRQTLATSRS
jgi:predicted GNAT family N-acyltransferase